MDCPNLNDTFEALPLITPADVKVPRCNLGGLAGKRRRLEDALDEHDEYEGVDSDSIDTSDHHMQHNRVSKMARREFVNKAADDMMVMLKF